MRFNVQTLHCQHSTGWPTITQAQQRKNMQELNHPSNYFCLVTILSGKFSFFMSLFVCMSLAMTGRTRRERSCLAISLLHFEDPVSKVVKWAACFLTPVQPTMYCYVEIDLRAALSDDAGRQLPIPVVEQQEKLLLLQCLH